MADDRLFKPSHGRKYPRSCNRSERPEGGSGFETAYRAFKIYRTQQKFDKDFYGYTGQWSETDTDTMLATVEISGGVDYGPGLVRTGQRYVGNAVYIKQVEVNSLSFRQSLLPFIPKTKIAVYPNDSPMMCVGVLFFDMDMINVPRLFINFVFETAILRIKPQTHGEREARSYKKLCVQKK